MKSETAERTPGFISVTPLAGVWVEIPSLPEDGDGTAVTPLAGVWVEIMQVKCRPKPEGVTPLAGVWVEMSQHNRGSQILGSLPLRECGLKLIKYLLILLLHRHSPCGSVG